MQLLDVENPFSETEDDPLLVSLGDKDITLDEVQRRLNSCKLTKLIVSIIKRPNLSHSVTLHATNLAVALLNGGNHQVQVTHHHSNLSYIVCLEFILGDIQALEFRGVLSQNALKISRCAERDQEPFDGSNDHRQ